MRTHLGAPVADRANWRPPDLTAAPGEISRRPLSRRDEAFVDTQLMRILSDETRVRIYAYLCDGEATRAEIQRDLAIPNNTVRYHVLCLEKGGWISSRFSGRQARYTATRPIVIPPGVWDDLPSPVREHVAARIWKRVLVDAEESMSAGFYLGPDVQLSLTPMVVDDEGRQRVKDWLESCVEGLVAIQREVDARGRPLGRQDRDLYSLTVFVTGHQAARDPADGIRASRTVRL
jgi:DNA-binding transcriptional ArsR family regulator